MQSVPPRRRSGGYRPRRSDTRPCGPPRLPALRLPHRDLSPPPESLPLCSRGSLPRRFPDRLASPADPRPSRALSEFLSGLLSPPRSRPRSRAPAAVSEFPPGSPSLRPQLTRPIRRSGLSGEFAGISALLSAHPGRIAGVLWEGTSPLEHEPASETRPKPKQEREPI